MSSKNDPPIGLVPWVCSLCGETWMVSGDPDDHVGWDLVREHRAEHKKGKKA